MRIYRYLALSFLLLIVLPKAYADGYESELADQAPPVESQVAPGSDASFDKRLPPVLPGEIVNDSGRKMRVWSSAGPVPINTPDQNRNRDYYDSRNPGDLNLFIDKRNVPKRDINKPSSPHEDRPHSNE